MKPYPYRDSKKRIKRRSKRKIIIDKVKVLMRDYLKKRDGAKCFFCGKHQGALRFPLSLFHILPISRYPKLECEIENTVLACFAPYHYGKHCHNYWETRQEPYKKEMELKLEIAKGNNYKEVLLIQDKILPKLNINRAEWYLEYYKQAIERLSNNEY